jgi:hypothetical protein
VLAIVTATAIYELKTYSHLKQKRHSFLNPFPNLDLVLAAKLFFTATPSPPCSKPSEPWLPLLKTRLMKLLPPSSRPRNEDSSSLFSRIKEKLASLTRRRDDKQRRSDGQKQPQKAA